MILLILGVALWCAAHFFKRLSPEKRLAMGEKGKGPIALAILASVVLMVIGYRMADGPVWWGPSPALVGINNLLMVAAIYMFAASGTKSRITGKIRHPQLLGFKIWAFAHLLVNGDLASFILFGGLLGWAVAQMILVNKAEGKDWTPAHAFPAVNEVKAVVGTIIVLVVVMLIHHFLGVTPWG